MSEESTRGRFAWHDLMTTDPEAAKDFYTSVMGWGTELWEAMSYTMWKVGDRPIGGTMKLPGEAVAGGARPHWLAYVDVPDVDATAARPHVDILLVLAADVSRSIDAGKYDLQRKGYAAALVDPRVLDAIASNPDKRIAVSLIEWADRYPDLIPKEAKWLSFELKDENTRLIREGKPQ